LQRAAFDAVAARRLRCRRPHVLSAQGRAARAPLEKHAFAVRLRAAAKAPDAVLAGDLVRQAAGLKPVERAVHGRAFAGMAGGM
jgi:hypothetical protein